MGKVQEYLQNLKFRKCTIGGVDEEDVLQKIKKLCELQREENEEREQEIEQLTCVNSDLLAKVRELENKPAPAREDDGELERAREEADRIKASYGEKLKELQETLELTQSIKRDATVRAQMEAAQEVARVKKEMMAKVEEQRREAEKEVDTLREEIRRLELRKEGAKREVGKEMEFLRNFLARTQRELEQLEGGADDSVYEIDWKKYR